MKSVTVADVRTAATRIAGRTVATPLLSSPYLDEIADCQLFVKAESLQLTGSFKLRGALNMMLALDAAAASRGVITYSAGNHGQGVAAAARSIGCPAVILLPNNAPETKVDSCRWWGGEVHTYDPRLDDREELVQQLIEQRGLTFIPPFDHPLIIAGQGTVGTEIVDSLQARAVEPDAVVMGASGGGLAAGVTLTMSHTYPDLRCYVAEPAGADKLARSLVSAQRVELPRSRPTTVMDALAGPVPGAHPLEVLRRLDVRGLTVTDAQALTAVRVASRMLKVVVEPGGAAALAAVLNNLKTFSGKTVVVIASGGNIDAALYQQALDEDALVEA